MSAGNAASGELTPQASKGLPMLVILNFFVIRPRAHGHVLLALPLSDEHDDGEVVVGSYSPGV